MFVCLDIMSSNLQKKKVRLVRSMIRFLKQESESTDLDGDQKEAIEVAVQCLETAYDLENKPDTKDAINLLDVIDAGPSEVWLLNHQLKCVSNVYFKLKVPEVSQEYKVNAEIHKVRGNNFMKLGQYLEALDAYSK